MRSLQPNGGGSRETLDSQVPQKVTRRAGMELWWIAVLVLAVASGGNCASLGNRLEREQENSIVEAVNTYNVDRNTSFVYGLPDSGTKGERIVKNCTTLITGNTANNTVIRCDPSKLLYVNSREQKQWRGERAEERREKGYETPSGLQIDSLNKLAKNYTEDIAKPECVSCVLCSLTNSCAK